MIFILSLKRWWKPYYVFALFQLVWDACASRCEKCLQYNIPSHPYVSILVFLSKRSEEVLLLFSCLWKFQKCVTGLK